MSDRNLTILGGGAVQGLVQALAPRFTADTGCAVDGTYGAVGAMREALLAGAPADLVILTASLVEGLARDGQVDAATIAVGVVQTGIAVRRGDPVPAIGDAASLRAALSVADAIYLPDPLRATAGIHFAGVLDALGSRAESAPKLRPFANGATAMRELAAAAGHPIGCTQVTEILATPGVTLAGLLPPGFGLATQYTAGICTRSDAPDLARDLARLIAGDAAHSIRTILGFDN